MVYNTTKIKAIKGYPTYQFHVKSLYEMIPKQDIFKICIFETFTWIRSRLEEFNTIPNQFDIPSVEDYVQLNLDDLYSFSVNICFTVDVVYVHSQRIWSFSMTEPDNERILVRKMNGLLYIEELSVQIYLSVWKKKVLKLLFAQYVWS